MASCVSELFVLRQTKFTVCTNKKKAFVFLIFFFNQEKKKYIRHDSKAVCVSGSKFWCWPMWKAAMFMHHDVAVLEQIL